MAARKFHPGQFYRLQNFETLAPVVGTGEERTRLQMEGLALTGAWVDANAGLVSTIVLEMGGSSRLVRTAQAGRAGRPDGADRHPDAHRRERDRDPRRRRPGQRGAVLDRPGVPRRRIEGALFRRLQEGDRPLQGRRHRGRRRRGRSGAATKSRDSSWPTAAPAAGPQLRRQYRAGDGRLRRRPAGRRRRYAWTTPTASSPSVRIA